MDDADNSIGSKFPDVKDFVRRALDATLMPSRIIDAFRKSAQQQVLSVCTLCSGSDAVIQSIEEWFECQQLLMGGCFKSLEETGG